MRHPAVGGCAACVRLPVIGQWCGVVNNQSINQAVDHWFIRQLTNRNRLKLVFVQKITFVYRVGSGAL